jgi:hypothetical protein
VPNMLGISCLDNRNYGKEVFNDIYQG